MNAKELLLDALRYYGIEIIVSENENITIWKNYTIHIEQSGIYKLLSNGQVIAPFDDLDELCSFVML